MFWIDFSKSENFLKKIKKCLKLFVLCLFADANHEAAAEAIENMADAVTHNWTMSMQDETKAGKNMGHSP